MSTNPRFARFATAGHRRSSSPPLPLAQKQAPAAAITSSASIAAGAPRWDPRFLGASTGAEGHGHELLRQPHHRNPTGFLWRRRHGWRPAGSSRPSALEDLVSLTLRAGAISAAVTVGMDVTAGSPLTGRSCETRILPPTVRTTGRGRCSGATRHSDACRRSDRRTAAEKGLGTAGLLQRGYRSSNGFGPSRVPSGAQRSPRRIWRA